MKTLSITKHVDHPKVWWAASVSSETKKLETLDLANRSGMFTAFLELLNRHRPAQDADEKYQTDTPETYREIESFFELNKKAGLFNLYFNTNQHMQDPILALNAAKSILDFSLTDLPNKIKSWGAALETASQRLAQEAHEKAETHPGRQKEIQLEKFKFAIEQLEDMVNCCESPKERIAALQKDIEDNKKLI